MTIIIFVRHGKALTNEKGILNSQIDGFPLTREGIAQTQRTAQELKKLFVIKLYTSPILRAVQTAEIIGEALDLKPKVDARLLDRDMDGEQNAVSNEGDWKLSVDWSKTGIEKFDSLVKRTNEFIDSIANQTGIIVVVTHDALIKVALMRIYKMGQEMENALKIRTSSMNIISTKGVWRLIAVNHLVLTDEIIENIKKSL